MSYSVQIRAATAALALAALAIKVDEICSQQPIHERDRAAILSNAEAVVGLLPEDETKEIVMSCNGSLGWSGVSVDTFDPATTPVISVSVNCTAYLAAPEPAAA